MKTFKFSFVGRQSGAIGIYYNITQEYKAKDIHEAMSLLYADYNMIKGLKEASGKEIPKEIKWVPVRPYSTRKTHHKTGIYID